MRPTPTRKVRATARKLLAILLPCLAFWAVWVTVISPMLGMSDDFYEQRDALLERMAADQRQIETGPAWRHDLEMLQQANSRSPGARTEATQVLAAAGLQNDVQTMLTQAGGEVLSVQILPSSTAGAYETVSVQISGSLPIVELPDFLRRLEMHLPYMFIQNATFQAPEGMAVQPTDDASTPVNIQFTVLAYRRL